MNGFWAKIGQKTSFFFMWALDNHPGKLIGSGLGFFAGLLMVTLGFWRTLILALFVSVGFILGKRQDDHKSFLAWLDRFFAK